MNQAARLFVSYAHEDENRAWKDSVRTFAELLADPFGFDVVHDQQGGYLMRDWSIWGPIEAEKAESIICLASPGYKERWAKHGTGAGEEARAIRRARERDVPVLWVVLPGRTPEDIPESERSFHWERVTTLDELGTSRVAAVLRRDDGTRRLPAAVPLFGSRRVRQLTRWDPSAPGVVIDGHSLLPWLRFKEELETKVFPRTREVLDKSSAELRDFRGKRNWLIEVCGEDLLPYGAVWVGPNPTLPSWPMDDRIRLGTGPEHRAATGSSSNVGVLIWATFLRLDNGDYDRL